MKPIEDLTNLAANYINSTNSITNKIDQDYMIIEISLQIMSKSITQELEK
jgi:hypothetical protein